MRFLLVAALVVGCANVSSPESRTEDAGEDAFEPARETSPREPIDDGVPDELADAVSLEAGSCATRANACTDASRDPLDAIIDACVNKDWSCGYFYFGIDAEGCATAVTFEREHTRPAFETCVIAELASKRFPCVPAGTARRYYSCTIK